MFNTVCTYLSLIGVYLLMLRNLSSEDDFVLEKWLLVELACAPRHGVMENFRTADEKNLSQPFCEVLRPHRRNIVKLLALPNSRQVCGYAICSQKGRKEMTCKSSEAW